MGTINDLSNKSLLQKIADKLEAKPVMRDNDLQLVASILFDQIQRNETMTAKDLLTKLAKGELYSTESICRISRDLQRKFPELRGANYEQRHSVTDKAISALETVRENLTFKD